MPHNTGLNSEPLVVPKVGHTRGGRTLLPPPFYSFGGTPQKKKQNKKKPRVWCPPQNSAFVRGEYVHSVAAAVVLFPCVHCERVCTPSTPSPLLLVSTLVVVVLMVVPSLVLFFRFLFRF